MIFLLSFYDQGLKIPPSIQFTREEFPALSSEELEKLQLHKPASLHEASQISGITPSSLMVLLNYITKKRYK